MGCNDSKLQEPNTTYVFNDTILDNSKELEQLSTFQFVSYNICIPILLSLGVIGNTLSIFLFLQRRMRHSLNELDKATIYWLSAVAWSNLLSCILGIPSPWLRTPFRNQAIQVYLSTYLSPLADILELTSTWLIVTVAAERSIAITQPFRTLLTVDKYLRLKKLIILVVLAICFSLPGFFQAKVNSYKCGQSCCYIKDLSSLFFFRVGYYSSIIIIKVLVPFIILSICKGFLIKAYRLNLKNFQTNAQDVDKNAISRMNIIIMAVVCLFFFLSFPSFCINYYVEVSRESEFIENRKITIVQTVLKVIAAFNSSANFILYATLSKKFRDILLNTVFRISRNQKSTCRNSQYRLITFRNHPNSVLSIDI